MKNYKKEYKQLKLIKEIEENRYNVIYIIPSEPYDGFWGKNGYNSFDFVLESWKDDKKGWFHWMGDIIEFSEISNLSLDSEVENGYIRLSTNSSDKFLKLNGVMISRIIISEDK